MFYVSVDSVSTQFVVHYRHNPEILQLLSDFRFC